MYVMTSSVVTENSTKISTENKNYFITPSRLQIKFLSAKCKNATPPNCAVVTCSTEKQEYQGSNCRKDCLNFATAVLEGLCIPQGVWLNTDAFKFMVGKDILTQKGKDYVRILGEEYGRKFHKTVKIYLKNRKAKDKISPPLSNTVQNGYAYECNNWTVPQSELPVDSIYSNQCLSPQMYSCLPEYNLSSPASLGEAQSLPYQNYNGSNYFPELPSPDDNLGEVEESLGYPTSDLFGLAGTSYTDPTCPSTGQFYSSPMKATGADGLSDITYPDIQSLCGSLDHSSLSSSSSIMDEDLDLLLEDLMRDVHMDDIESIDFDVAGLSELDVYMPTPSPTPIYTNPLGNVAYSAEGAVASSSVSSSPLEKKLHMKIVAGKRKNRTRNPKSWEFLVRLLTDPQTNPSLIKWEDKDTGTFRLVNKDEIARLWGRRTDKHKEEALSYENFARIMRYHYKSSGMLKAVSEKHLVYKLGDSLLKDLKEKNLI